MTMLPMRWPVSLSPYCLSSKRLPTGLPRRAVEATIAGMRDDGMNDASIEQAVNLPPISRAEHAAATALWNMRSGTAEWVKRLTSGDYQAKLEWRNLTTLLSSPIQEE